jgi:hypothetical protein
MTAAEDWFDRYVRDHGHDPGEPEPDLGIEKKPDRLIRWNGVEVVCEVKQFDNDPFGDWNGQSRMMDMQTALKAVRRPVSYAAEQLVAAQFDTVAAVAEGCDALAAGGMMPAGVWL